MKKLLGALVILVLAIVAGFAWINEWFVSTPTSVVTRSLMQANAGKYEAACEGLPTGQRQQLLGDPELMKAVWDRITKNRTVANVAVTNEDRGITGTFGTIKVAVDYTDGSKRSAITKISHLNGRWSFGAAELSEAFGAGARPEANPAAPSKQTAKLALSRDYSPVGTSGVSLRIPEGIVWDATKQVYDDPTTGLLIQLDRSAGGSFESRVDFVEKQWKSPNRVLNSRQDLSKNAFKAFLFDGEAINEKGRGWCLMHLIIGDDDKSALISATFPNLDAFRQPMRECLTSARWESGSK